jgi:two-component system, NtrC family, response regulator HydG
MSNVDPSTIAHADAPRPHAMRFEVRVTAGADAGSVLPVSARSAGRLFLGTSAACHLRLSDRRVSRRHLSLDVTREGLRITDLGSTNGTTLNGIRVVDAFCRGGEILVVGDSTLSVDVDHAEEEAPDVRMAFGPLVGASLAMRRLYRTCDALAHSRAPLLVEGEPGTGKTTLAEALHLAGPSSSCPFVITDGASFAAAPRDALREARGGTLLVRGIADVPLEAQPEVARAIAGAAAEGVRIVATSTVDVEAAVEFGVFREELARELSSRIELPSLAARRGDIALLVESFCRALGTTSAVIPPRQLAALNRRDYPGNVRELSTLVLELVAGGALERAGAAGAQPPTPEDLGVELGWRDVLVARRPFGEAKQEVLDRFASAYVDYAVAVHGGHVARAAAASGLAPRYFNILRARSRSRDSNEGR